MAKLKKCDIFTPDHIGEKMSSYLNGSGNILEPSVGTGKLLNHIKYSNYNNIDIFDIEQQYLDEIKNANNLNKNLCDFLKTEIITKYNDIIMNPPYIKFQELDPEYRTFIKNKYPLLKTGNIDIYLAFILKAIELLRDDGILVSINPNSFLYNKSCTNFREYLISNRFVAEIIDFNSEKVFENVDVYCCIVIINKNQKDHMIYNGRKINYSDIKTSFFEMLSETKTGDTLEKHIEISNGFATLRDRVFIHNEKLFDEPCWKETYKVSKNIIKYVICPYDNNAKIIAEDVFKITNPNTYNFLLSKKDELSKRDRGNKKYEAWYAFGRKQGLKILKENDTPFLYISTMCNKELKNYCKASMLYYSGLAIKIKENSAMTLAEVKTIIAKNTDNIYNKSSKRGNGWFNLSGTTIKQLYIS